MRGEEFFGEIREQKAIDDFDVKGYSVVALIFLVVLTLEVPTIHTLLPLVDVFFFASYLLEVVGFIIIFADLFFEEQTKKFLDWYPRLMPSHPQFLGWKVVLISCIVVLIPTVFFEVLFIISFPDTRLAIEIVSVTPPLIAFFVTIYPGVTLVALKRKNDKILAMGTGIAIVGLTFATSAYINTLFI